MMYNKLDRLRRTWFYLTNPNEELKNKEKAFQ